MEAVKWRDISRDEFAVIRQVVKQVCRFSPMDEPEVLSRTLERMSRWYDPEVDSDVTLVQAARQRANLALLDVQAAAPPEIPVDLNASEWDDLSPLWIRAEESMPEEELHRSDDWVDLIGSVVAGVGIPAATVVEMLFRGRLTERQIAEQLGSKRDRVHYLWMKARNYLRSVLPEPSPPTERKRVRSGAWGTVRGVVHHSL